MKTKIKICGLRTQEDIRIVNREKPDYAGFVFAPGKRQIDISQAKILKSFLEPEITAVGVFVNPKIKAHPCIQQNHVSFGASFLSRKNVLCDLCIFFRSSADQLFQSASP